jgi:hypothetical protein
MRFSTDTESVRNGIREYLQTLPHLSVSELYHAQFIFKYGYAAGYSVVDSGAREHRQMLRREAVDFYNLSQCKRLDAVEIGHFLAGYDFALEEADL